MTQKSESSIVAGAAAVLARRYATALYELADEQNQLDAVAADLRSVKILMQESVEFRALTVNPRLAHGQLVKAMQRIAEVAKFSALTGNFLALVAQNRRLRQLNLIVDNFLATLASRRGEFTAEVRTAQALTPAQQEQLAAQLRPLAGGKVHLTIEEDPSLLGGLTVKWGSRLIDASVKNKLARLERRLKSQPVTQGEAA